MNADDGIGVVKQAQSERKIVFNPCLCNFGAQTTVWQICNAQWGGQRGRSWQNLYWANHHPYRGSASIFNGFSNNV
jgi:hypothetical protein